MGHAVGDFQIHIHLVDYREWQADRQFGGGRGRNAPQGCFCDSATGLFWAAGAFMGASAGEPEAFELGSTALGGNGAVAQSCATGDRDRCYDER